MNKKYTRKNKGKGKSKSRSRTIKQKAATKIQRMTRKRLSKKQKALEKINKATIKLKRKKDVCPICLEKIDKKNIVETNCGHFFHRNCINNWCLQKARDNMDCKCPICKKNLPEIQHRAQKKLAKLIKEKKEKLPNTIRQERHRGWVEEQRAINNREREEIQTRMAERQTRMAEIQTRRAEIQREREENQQRINEFRRIRRQERQRNNEPESSSSSSSSSSN
jgi:hypothetical protein